MVLYPAFARRQFHRKTSWSHAFAPVWSYIGKLLACVALAVVAVAVLGATLGFMVVLALW